MKHGRFAIALAIAVSAAIYLNDTPETTPATAAITPPQPETQTRVSLESERVSAPTSRTDETESPETEIVMGIPVLKDRNCTVTRHYVDLGNGTVTEAFSCIPHETRPDPYQQYSNKELEILAYSDAKAASALGKRLVGADLKRSREMMLRAVALEPGNVEPVMWLASQAYSLRGDSRAARTATADAYVITNTARALGSKADINWIVDDLRDTGLTDEGFAVLDRSVREDLNAIRAIQLEVFGQSTIEEDSL